MERKLNPDATYGKAGGKPEVSGTGSICGYAAVFDNVDLQGDIIRKGAFAKSIQERVAAGKCPLMTRHWAHGGDGPEAIGIIKKAVEDDFGLWIDAELYKCQLAEELREKVKMSPGMFGMSVGFRHVQMKPIMDEKGQTTGYELLELKLCEVTLTLTPANEETTATAKAQETELLQRIGALEKTIAEMSKTPQSTEPEAPGKQAAPPAGEHARKIEAEKRKRRIALLAMEK